MNDIVRIKSIVEQMDRTLKKIDKMSTVIAASSTGNSNASLAGLQSIFRPEKDPLPPEIQDRIQTEVLRKFRQPILDCIKVIAENEMDLLRIELQKLESQIQLKQS